jgi:hypothetical protein
MTAAHKTLYQTLPHNIFLDIMNMLDDLVGIFVFRRKSLTVSYGLK